jgi:hypothetical protein
LISFLTTGIIGTGAFVNFATDGKLHPGVVLVSVRYTKRLTIPISYSVDSNRLFGEVPWDQASSSYLEQVGERSLYPHGKMR